MSRPNLLLILSDQHNARVMGCAGDAAARTPHLDRLAAGGVLFENAYCAGPLCVPSRMTFLTSRHCSDIEVWTNACRMHPDEVTFPHLLSLAGCETLLCGRMHFVGPDQHRGYQRRLVGDVIGAMNRPGEMFAGVIPQATCGQTYATHCVTGPGHSTYIAYDDAVFARARRYLDERDRQDAQEPFCLTVGTVLPHCPYVCPKGLFEEYMDRLPPLLEASSAYRENLHPAMRRWHEVRGTARITPEQARRARAAYYGLVTYLDALIGGLLETLAGTRFAENTVVAYVSDHGDMIGQHGMWWKDSFYDGSVGVPMIWSWPGRFPSGARVRRVTSLLDVGPTCLDLAGADPLPGARGHSLCRLLEGDDPDWPDEAFAEAYPAGDRPARMIRRGPWKLNAYHGYREPQLFHLERDPLEEHDLRADPEHARVRRELLRRVRDGWSPARTEETVVRRRQSLAVVQQWHGRVEMGESDVWEIPPGCNRLDDV